MPRVLPSEETKEGVAARLPTTPPVAAIAGSTPGGSKRPRTAEEKAIAARLGESRAGWLRKAKKTEPVPDEDYIEPEWMEGLSEQQISAINMWTLHNPKKAKLSTFLNSPLLILFWVLLLVVDLALMLEFADDEPLWVDVTHHVVSGLFALDVCTRLYLHRSSHDEMTTFWHDKMNCLDATLVFLDVAAIVATVAIGFASAKEGGAVKSARSLRLVRLLRSARIVRILRLGRVGQLVASNYDWFVYRLDMKLQEPFWKAVVMVFILVIFMLLAGAFFYALKPVALGSNDDLSGATPEELEELRMKYPDTVWEMWTFLADPGSHGDVCERFAKNVSCTSLQVFSGSIAVIGICYFAAVLGFVVDGIKDFLDELKRGTRAIVESDHVIILGCNVKAIALITEICDALESEGGGTIVVMDDLDKSVMDAQISPYLGKAELRGSRVVTRRGSPMVQLDLMKASVSTARSLIVMAQQGFSADASDAQAVRVVLALKGLHPPLRGHVVVELMDIDNRSIVELIGEPMVETVVSHDLTGRLMLLSARNPGVNGVYDEIFGFQHDEFYIKRWPQLVGKTFAEITFMFPDAVPLGFKRRKRRNRPDHVIDRDAEVEADWVHTKEGRFQKYGIEINPPQDSVMEPGDGLLVLAADDDSYAPSETGYALDVQPKVNLPLRTQKKDRTLVCGWRRDIDDMINSLDAEVKKGSELHILCELDVEAREQQLLHGNLAELKNLTLVHHVGNSAVRRVLEKLPLASFHYVLILADEMREERPLDSDAHNLATLLLLRDLRHRQGLATVRAQQKAMDLDDLQPKHGHKHRHKHNKKDAKPVELNAKAAPQPKSLVGKMVKGISHRVLQRSNSKNNLQASSLSSIPKPSTPERVFAMNQRLGSASSGLAAPSSPSGDSTQELSDSEGYPWHDHRPGTANTAASNDDTYSTAGIFSPSDATYQTKTPAEEKQRGEAFDAGLLRAIQIQRVNSMGHEALEEDDKSLIDSDDNKSLDKNTPRRGKGFVKESNGSGGADSNTRVTFTGPGGALEATSKHSTSESGDLPSKAKAHHALRKQRFIAAKAAAAAAMAEADMCMIAVEILDSRTKSTLQSEPSIRAAADYLLSHTTMSKVLAMVLMQREVKGVLEELLSEEGQSFFVHQATRYCGVNEVAAFWDIASRALSCNEVLVGYRPTSSGTTIINPLAKHEPRIWGEYDLIVVCCDTAAMMTPAKLAMKRLKRYSSLPINLLKGFANKKTSASDGDASSVSKVFSRATAGAMAQGALWPRTHGASTDAKSSDNAAASDVQAMPQLTLDSPDGQASSVVPENLSVASEATKPTASQQLVSPVAVKFAVLGSPSAGRVQAQNSVARTGNTQALPTISSGGNGGSRQAPMLATVTAASEFTDQVRIFALNNAMEGTGGPTRRKKRESESDVSDESGSSEYESESSDEIPKDGTGSFEVEDTPKTKLRKQRSEKRISKRASPKASRDKVASTSAAIETASGGEAGSTQLQASSGAAIADPTSTRASAPPPPARGSPELAPLNGRSVSPLPMTSPSERNLPSLLATPTRSGNNSLERASTPDSMRSTSAL